MQMKTQIGLLIFALVGSIYFLSVRGNIEISDTYFSVQTAKAIVDNCSLSAPGCQSGYCYKSQKDGKLYSRYGLGLAFIFTPYILLGKTIVLFTGLAENKVIDSLISFYNIFFGAGACVVMFYIIKFFGNSNRISLIMSLLLGLATFCWRYSTWDFSEATQMFFLLLTVYYVLKNSLKNLTFGGLSFSCLLLLKAIYIIYIPIFVLYILARNRRNMKDVFSHAGLFILTALLGLSLMLFLNYVRFGQIFEFGYGAEANNFYLSGIKEHTVKLLYWLDKGIFVYNPLFILSIIGYFKFFKLFRKEAFFFISIIALNFFLTSMWYAWHGCSSWGPRLLVPTAPLWLIPCFVFFGKNNLTKIVLAAFIFVSVLIQGISILGGNLEYQTICNANGQEGIKKGMPAQVIGSLIMLKHKITKNDNVYNLSEFGINSATKVDTSNFSYYRGFDLWYINAAKYFNRPTFLLVPVLFLPFIIIIFIRLLKITKISWL